MQMPLGRLFWRIFFVGWLSMVAAFVCAAFYMHVSGLQPPDAPRWIFLIPVLAGATVSLPVALGLAWHISKPVRHLTQALRDAAWARFDVRVSPALGSRSDEFALLAHEFDDMAARLQQTATQQRQLFHDVSHELRSPLARIQAAVGLMQQDPQSAPAMAERVARETQRLDQLIGELLTLHKLEAGAVDPAARERMDVMEILDDIVQDAVFEALGRNCLVTLDAPGSFVAEVAGELLYRALENVVRNAIKYTAANTVVDVNARILASPQGGNGAPEWLEIRVSDRGPGVPAESCEDIFEPFHRLQPPLHAGAPSVPGTGLGLAIARRALTLHGGEIHAKPREGGGLDVIIRLPSSASRFT
ncbi:HAMP domain-containing histidine kinase [Ralstonia solanacearum]|uniref:HAMP domain-containing sensor histidine kinase n=1 Tax=Ralstonia pseudosolanacearum TaxID=1310165 RepID=UPI000C9F93E8|nr:ATP-binding protein [Ralstonia pseudosolanacearum]AUS43368.1 HAMP domain-containing histidine kinase [Ralstonia solanacearum]